MRPVKGTEKPMFTEEQLTYLERMFPVVEVQPQNAMETIMYEAGIQKVLQRVRERTVGYRKVQL